MDELSNEVRISALEVVKDSLQSQLNLFCDFLSSGNCDRRELEIRYKIIYPLLDRYARTIHELRRFNPSHSALYGDFERQYYSALARAEALRVPDFPVNPVPNSLVFSAPVFPPNLQPANLPQFGGNPHEWDSYFEMFDALVNKNQYLSQIQKFHYLKASLHGEARDLLNTIHFSAQNYESALSTLKNQYENKKLRVYHLVKQLQDLPRMTREEPNAVQNLSFQFTQSINMLNSLNLTPPPKCAFLTTLIISKFDDATLRAWEKNSNSCEFPEWKNLLTFLHTQKQLSHSVVYHREVNNVAKLSDKNPGNKPFHRVSPKNAGKVTKRYKTQHSHSFAATTVEKPATFAALKECYLCNEKSHYIFHCEKFLNLAIPDRRSAILKLKLCENCLRKNCYAASCKHTSCRKCNQKHNTLIHSSENSRPGKSRSD